MAEGTNAEIEDVFGRMILVDNSWKLRAEVDTLRQGRILKEKSEIYTLWKSLLDCWFRDQYSKMFLVTPFLDKRRVYEICQFVIKHESTANLGGLYVRNPCYNRSTINEYVYSLKTKTKQMEIAKKIYEEATTTRHFHCKFMACVKYRYTHVIVISANCTNHHFDYDNLETVVYLTMSDAEFNESYLDPLNR